MLRFAAVILDAGYNVSPNKSSTVPLTKRLVNCDVITDYYRNDITSQCIYSFPPSYMSYQLISEVLRDPERFQINRRYVIDSIRIWLTEQNGAPISSNGNNLTVRLRFESI